METPRKGPSGIRPAALRTGTDGYGEPSASGGGVALLQAEPEQPRDFYSTEEWQLACRVAASKGLSKSELLPKFLLHICELSLRGRADEITEQRIGTQIFNRPPDYNPGEDNIVRSYARTMRKRLDDYFDHEGRHERMRIHIPRGGYVPVFEPAHGIGRVDARKLREPMISGFQATQQPAFADLLEVLEVQAVPPLRPAIAAGAVRQVRRPTLASLWVVALIAMIVGALLATAGWLKWTAIKTSHERSAAHAIWSQLFQPNRNMLIVPADSGLGILENLSKHAVTVEQYANGSYLEQMPLPPGIDQGNFDDLGRQRYTSVADLDIAAKLARLPEYIPSRAQIRYPRGVMADDLKESNAILIGSKHTNPWVMLFEKGMNFTLEYTSTVDESYIVNHSPRTGEQKIYRNGARDSSSPTYGVIAYLPSLDASGHVLIIEGLNMAATEAAAEILFNEKMIGPVLQRAKLPDGTLRPFELLVETKSVGATSPGAQIIDTRIHE